MEDEICQYEKYGYCKFKSECKRKHLSEECKDLENCKSIKSCDKRHPKRCKKHDSGKCRFEETCAYKHLKPTKIKEYEILKEKVEKLEQVVQMEQAKNKDSDILKEKLQKVEIVVHALTRKVLSLESELGKVEKKDTNILNVDESKDPKTKPEIKSTEMLFSDNKSVLAPKDAKYLKKDKDMKYKKDMAEDNDSKEVFLNCNKCKYKCKKENLLKKHMTSKHEEHQCKECEKYLPTSFELLLHTSKHHSNFQGERKDEENIQKEKYKEKDEIHKEEIAKTDHEFDEAMLDGYISE